jgi:RimJ/RimL family protein N-acetyltransferase
LQGSVRLPFQRSVQVHLRLCPEDANRLRRLATDLDQTTSALVRRMCRTDPPRRDDFRQRRPMKTYAESWRQTLPTLDIDGGCVREPLDEDAVALLAALSSPAVVRYAAPPPQSPDAFCEWLGRARSQRKEGRFACFAIVPRSSSVPAGLIQLWNPHTADGCPPDRQRWRWGFALDPKFWGSGLFLSAASVVTTFVFLHVGVRRLDAYCQDDNVRANRALARLGATNHGSVTLADPAGASGTFVLWSLYGSQTDICI